MTNDNHAQVPVVEQKSPPPPPEHQAPKCPFCRHSISAWRVTLYPVLGQPTVVAFSCPKSGCNLVLGVTAIPEMVREQPLIVTPELRPPANLADMSPR